MTDYTLPKQVSELMTPSPISVKAHYTVHEAILLMTEHKISALPVVTETNEPIGVLSQKDILQFNREQSEYPVFYQQADLFEGYMDIDDGHLENADMTKVEEIMTPVVFSVSPDELTQDTISAMLKQKVHRLFVVDDANALCGVVSVFDILKALEMKPVSV